jgi:hypothetical protein
MRMVIVILLFAGSASGAELPAWLAGSWRGTSNGTAMEEHWTSAAGTMMVGMHRDIRANGRTLFEYMRIEKSGDTLIFQGSPGGRPATPFPMREQSATRIVFENAAHDFPQRIIYWKADRQLCARVEGTIKQKLESEEWCWARF